MMVLNNLYHAFLDNFNYYYHNLTNDNRLIFYIILILLFITLILILIMFDQRRLNVKVIKTIKPPFNNNEAAEEELDIDEDNEKTRNLKVIADKLQAVIDNKNINLTNFEEEQEANSIISYDELLSRMKQSKIDEKQEKFVLPDLVKKMEVDEIIKTEEKALTSDSVYKFKKSDFISPVFGIEKETNKANHLNKNQKEEEIEVLGLNDERQDNYNLKLNQNETTLNEEEQFLKTLKEFRNKLD